MKTPVKRVLSFLMVLGMLLSLAPTACATPSAADIITPPTGYTSAKDVTDTTINGYIANWGARGEDCVFLSSNGASFYTGSYSFDKLSALSGGTTQANASDSQLYTSLQSLMEENHTTFTTYGGSSSKDCKNFYGYTDCYGGDTSKVSLLYLGDTVSSTWDSGSTYNQEHMWPKSKCVSTNEIGDIMHLRAANPKENSSRGNTAYGESSGYYDPGVSVRGDCARTVLYMYVRWGNTANMWGTEGVMESADILLKWMEEDPVDTWEMGRNDSVQSITGTRNVFVDYPEFAWQLFGKNVPTNMTTPSSGSSVSTDPTVPTNPTEPTEPVAPDPTDMAAVLVTDVSALSVGDRIIIAAADYDYALGTVQNNNNRSQTAIEKATDGSALTYNTETQVITLESGSSANTFAFNVGEDQYLYAASSSSNYLRTTNAITANASWKITIDSASGIASVVANGSNTRNTLRYNSSASLFACYSPSNSQKNIMIYRINSSGNVHSHSYEAIVTLPDCTQNGYTTYTCACGDSYTADEVPATGHSYTDGVCGNCGAADPGYIAPEVVDYYLVGYINGADYGCESDYQNMGDYEFVNGKLVVTFDQDSYVFLKTTDNADWYMTKSYETGTSATFYNTTDGASEKMLIPGGVEITFTLAENSDGSLTLSYTKAEPAVKPSITLKGTTLSLEDEILYNLYFTTSDMDVAPENMGMLVFNSQPANVSVSNADQKIDGAIISSNMYMVSTEGISGKNLGDTVYLVAYAKLDDGSYVYSSVLPYSAKSYCFDRLEKSSNANLKALCVAILNYGAAAQEYFAATSDYTYTTLMNADLTADQKALVKAYSADMVAARGTVTADKTGIFGTTSTATGFSGRGVTMSADGIFSINYYFTTSTTVSSVTMYYWTAADFANASTLTKSNATGSKAMTATGKTNQFWADIDGIAAKNLDDTIYVCGVYTVNGTTYTTGVIPYSLGYYCVSMAQSGSDVMKPMAAATAVYGYYAKTYFGA